MKQKKKIKNADETLEILDYNKNAQKKISAYIKSWQKKKWKLKTEESIAKRVKLKNEKIAETKEEEKKYKQFIV